MNGARRMRVFVVAFGLAVATFMVWSLWLNRSVAELQSQLGDSVSLTSRIEGIEPSLRELEDVLSEGALGGDGSVDEETWNRAARGYAERVALLPRDEEIAGLLARTDQCARRIQALGREVQRSPATADVRLARISEARQQLRLGLVAIQESSQVLLQRSSALSTDLARERRQLDNMAIIACLLAALASGLMELSRRDHQKLEAAERRLRAAHRAVEAHAAELAQRKEELERSNSELERFAYVASHDLQEPLRAVASHVQILEQDYKGRLDADADESIRHAVEGAAHMRQLISDLLAYSRVGRKSDPLQPTSAAQALATALRQLQVAIAESGAQVAHDELPEVLADSTQLIQLFQNLVGNALKFRGGERARVHVGVERTNGGVALLREGQRDRHRSAVRRAHLRALRAPPRPARVSRYRRRPRDLQEDRRAPRRADLGRVRDGEGLDVPLHDARAAGGARPRSSLPVEAGRRGPGRRDLATDSWATCDSWPERIWLRSRTSTRGFRP